MDANTRPIGAPSLAALMQQGPLHRIGDWPIQSACRVTLGGVDSIWIALNHPIWLGRTNYTALWQRVFPTQRISPGYEVRALLSAAEATRLHAQFVRVDLVSTSSKNSKGYVLTSVQHSATDNTY